MDEQGELQDAIEYALRAPETKRQWPSILKTFLDYVFPSSIQEKANEFVLKSRQYPEPFYLRKDHNRIVAHNRSSFEDTRNCQLTKRKE